MMGVRIGIDVGGTFTDVTAFDEEKRAIVLIEKYTSNPADPMAVMEQIAAELGEKFAPSAVTLVLHGSTAALNTLLEDKGARVGLLSTKGFRDVYQIGRQWRGDDVFNLFAPAPKMLTRRRCIREVSERLDARGEVILPLNEAELADAISALRQENVEAIAVTFLFAYTNPAHEQQAARAIGALAPDVYVSLSSQVNPEWREYERTASTVANAYIGPPVVRYLQALEKLSAVCFPASRMLMMKSDGGAASARMLAPTPIQTVMSGPVAGVIGSRALGDLKGLDNLISFDTGGTSCDMAVIPGRPLFKSEVSVGRHPIRTQTVDIETIGAGGGSIASVELGGVLKVGPQSAGAQPGPACYGRGGSAATLTDALVVLGHISDTTLLNGAMPIARDKAWAAIEEHVARPLAMTAQEAAWGVLTVLTTSCTAAMRTITVERGYDPREFTLVPFGGMGPTIAGTIAADLGIGRILVPRDPGTFSAWGMLVTDVHQEHSVTRLTPLETATAEDVDSVFRAMEERAIDDLVRERFPRERISTRRYAGMRYRGQSYEVNVPVAGSIGPAALARLGEDFHSAHQQRYGHSAANEAIEIVNFKVTGVGAIPKPDWPRVPCGSAEPAAPAERRRAAWGPTLRMETAVYRRPQLAPDDVIIGPAIIEEQTSTTVIYPRQTARVDRYGHLEIEMTLA